MSYIGNPIVSTDFPVNYFSGNGATVAFTMSIAPASVNAIDVQVSGVSQSPQTYSVSGTTLTFTAAPPTGSSNIVVRHRGVAGIPNTPSAGSVVNNSIADATITAAKFAAGQTPSFNGITFPATQSASADANTLDDYEEGSWTPSVGGNATYSSQVGLYTKIGNLVTVNFDITISTLGTGSQRVINSLPFTAAANASSGGGIGFFQSTSASITYITCRADSSSSNLVIDANSVATTTMNGVNVFQNGTRLIGSVTYRAS